VAAGAQPKEPEKVHEPSMLGEDLKKRDAYEDGKAPFFCRSEVCVNFIRITHHQYQFTPPPPPTPHVKFNNNITTATQPNS
jgi:hypothetical protein